MTKKSVANIRFAAGDARSDLLYNAYHLLTQLSAMYTHFTANVQSGEHQQIFETLSIEILTDIGDLYVAWESSDRSSIAPSSAKKTNMSLMLTCNHLFRVVTLTDAWTPFVRYARIAGYLERKWLRILTELKQDAGIELVVLIELSKRAELRAQSIMEHLDKIITKDGQVQKAFDAEISLLDKSLGF